MNAVLNIQIRVASQQAQQSLTQVRKTLIQLNQAGVGGAATSLMNFGNQLNTVGSKMVGFGKNLNWTGRQLTYSFTLPILAAGAAATKFAFQNEAAMTQLRKVYDIANAGSVEVRNELTALGRTMELLSGKFAVNQAEVLGVAKTWAEAGSAGVGLAKSVAMTLEASAVGSLDLERTTRGLISIQSAYGLSADELRLSLAELNRIQVESGIEFGGLIEVIARAGGTAKSAGIDMAHLAAMAAAIVPAAGTAAQAGNGLRTIISRMIAPTRQAVEVMREMGINVDEASWQALNGTQRFEKLATEFNALSDAQKGVASSVIFARYQLNRADVLMADVVKKGGFYQQSLRAIGYEWGKTGSAMDEQARKTQVLAQYQTQLLTVLESSPHRMKMLWTMLQNALAKIIIPLIPAILGLVSRIVGMVQWFANLSPRVRQFILLGFMMLALFGPLLSNMAAMIMLLGLMFKGFGQVVTAIGWAIGRMMVWRATQAANAAAAAAYAAQQAAAARLAAGQYSKSWTTASAQAAAAQGTLVPAAGAANAGAAGAHATGGASVTNIWANVARALGVSQGSFPVAAAGAATGAAGAHAAGAAVVTNIWSNSARALSSGQLALPAAAGMAVGTTLVLHAGAAAAVTRTWIVTSGGVVLSQFALPLAAGGAMLAMGAIHTGGAAFVVNVWRKIAEALGLTQMALPAAAGTAAALTAGIHGSAALATQQAWGAAVTSIDAAQLSLPAASGVAALGMNQVFVVSAAGVVTAWVPAVQTIDAALLTIPATAIPAAATTAGAITVAAGESAVAVTTAVGVMEASVIGWPLVVAAAVAAVVILIALAAYKFREQLGDAARWVAARFVDMVEIIGRAIMSIVRSVHDAFLEMTTMGKHISSSTGAQKTVKETLPKQAGEPGFIGPVQQVQRSISGPGAPRRLPKPGEPGFIGPVPGLVQTPLQKAMQKMLGGGFGEEVDDVQAQLNDIKMPDLGADKKILSATGRKELDAFVRLMPELDRILQDTTMSLEQQSNAITDWQAKLERANDLIQLSQDRIELMELAPDLIPSFDALVARLGPLYTKLEQITTEMRAQERVVDGLKVALDAANQAYEEANNQLDILKDRASAAKDALDRAKDVLDTLVDTPIEGMKAMNDAIFDNEMAQKRLRLEILKMEEAGGSLDEIKKKLAEMRGALEDLRAERETLRLAGAGSEILGTYDEDIAKMEDAISGLEGKSLPIQKLTDELEKLQRQGEIMDLEKSLKFDPLTKQIDDLVNGMKEVPFDELYSKIVTQKGIVDNLTTAWDEATKAVEAQQPVVDALRQKRDEIQATYDKEKNKLDTLKDTYDGLKGGIDDITTALGNLTTAIDNVDMSEMLKQFEAAAGHDFPKIGGDSVIDREGFLKDIEEFNRVLQEELEKMGDDIGKIDIFEPFKEKLRGVAEWLKKPENYIPMGTGAVVGGAIGYALGGPIGGVLGAILGAIIGPLLWKGLQAAWDWVMEHKLQFALAVAAGILAMVLGVPTILAGLIAAAVLVLGPVLWEWLQKAWDWVLDHKAQTAAAIAAGILAIILGVPLVLVGLIAAAVLILGPILWDWIQKAWDWVLDHKAQTAAAIAAGILAIILGVPLVLAGLIAAAVLLLGPTLWEWIQKGWDWVMEHKLQIAAAIAAGVLAILLGVPVALAALLATAVLLLGPKLKEWVMKGWDWVMENKGSIIDAVTRFFTETIPNAVGSAASNIWRGFVDGFKQAIRDIIEAWNRLDFKVPEIDTHIPGVGKVGGWDLFPDMTIPGWLLPAAYNGAIVRGSASGSIIRAGERYQSEAIIPLDRLGGGEQKHYYINGNLSFPNIKSGEDAEAFISNLERLVS